MRFMILVKATAESEAGTMPSTELLQAMGAYNDALVKAGVMKAGEGLRPSSAGRRVRFDGADRTVAEGPFEATGELVAGFWLWELPSIDDAVAWVKRCPNPMPGPSEIEIRRCSRRPTSRKADRRQHRLISVLTEIKESQTMAT